MPPSDCSRISHNYFAKKQDQVKRSIDLFGKQLYKMFFRAVYILSYFLQIS